MTLAVHSRLVVDTVVRRREVLVLVVMLGQKLAALVSRVVVSRNSAVALSLGYVAISSAVIVPPSIAALLLTPKADSIADSVVQIPLVVVDFHLVVNHQGYVVILRVLAKFVVKKGKFAPREDVALKGQLGSRNVAVVIQDSLV